MKINIEHFKAKATAAIANNDQYKEYYIIALAVIVIEQHHIKHKIAFDFWCRQHCIDHLINAEAYNEYIDNGLGESAIDHFEDLQEIARYTKTDSKNGLLIDINKPDFWHC